MIIRLLLLCCAFVAPSLANEIIAVKFRENSSAFSTWKAAGRIGEIEALRHLFGSHQTSPLVRDATLKMIRKKELEQSLLKLKSSLADNLSRICGIEFSNDRDIALIIGKLRSFPDFEYAEPMPKRYFVEDYPNDPYWDKLYHLRVVKAVEAWKEIDTAASPLTLGIVDTGVDYLHEDLSPVMYVNAGEDGTDSLGRNKRSNGVDDDNNGYVDDWHGWDFVSSTSPKGGDNDPMPGNPHGTHVAGIAAAAVNNGIGIAGAAINVRILPVKIGNDIGSNSVSNSYDGLLYAAAAGAKVINCSWGGQAGSESEAEIVHTAQELGALIVAAAGNDGLDSPFYPAAYPGVVSVAATDENDYKTGFSNYNGTVDVCAPGLNIYSTLPKNEYGYNSGTSMASPIGAGLGALVRLKHPEYSAVQAAAHIKATADNVDSLNFGYIGKLGSGRVNFLKAISEKNIKWAEMVSFKLKEQNPDGIFSPNEQITATLQIRNVLSPLSNATVSISTLPSLNIIPQPQQINIGKIASGEEVTLPQSFTFTIPAEIPANYRLEWRVAIIDSGLTSTSYFSLIVNPTYREMNANNLAVTFNSRGNIGYNDYPSNMQGNGFRFKNSSNLMYESGLMVGVSAENLSDVVRSSNQSVQDNSFHPASIFTTTFPGIISLMDGQAQFADTNGLFDAGVSVSQHCHQFSGEGRENFVVITYDITNKTNKTMLNLHAGLFYDWDIGPSGDNNISRFDGSDGYGYAYNAVDSTLPYTGATLLTNQPLNFFAIDNDGTTADNPGVYDGFTRDEKWQTMSSGLARMISSQGDISMVLAAGPITLEAGKTTRVAFAIGAAPNHDELTKGIREIRKAADEYNIASGFNFESLPLLPALTKVFPNPVMQNDDIQTEIYFPSALDDVKLTIYDILGKKATESHIGAVDAGFHRFTLSAASIYSGMYFVHLESQGHRNSLPFIFVR